MSYRPAAEAHGFIYLISSGVTAITGGAGPVKLTCTTNSGILHEVSHPTNNKLVYLPERPSIVHGIASGCFSFSGANATTTFWVAVNGSTSPMFQMSRFTSTSSDVGSFSLNGAVTVSQNQYFELYASSDKNGNLTLLNLMMSLFEIHQHPE